MTAHHSIFPAHIGSSFFAQESERTSKFVQPSSSNNSSSMPSVSSSSSTIVPTTSTVVIGKGSVPKKAPGNLKLRKLVQEKIPEYVNATSKMVKSSIVSDIYFSIEESCMEEGNSPPFVRYDRNGYTKSSESIAREKITSTFRDCLHDKYKSSSKNKVAKRRLANKKKAESKREMMQRIQREQLSALRNELSLIRQSEEGSSSMPALVQSSYPLQQQRSQQHNQQPFYRNDSSETVTCINFHCENNNSMQDLFKTLFTSGELNQFPVPEPHSVSSSSVVEFDRTFIDVDLEPVPILELDNTSCSSSSCSCQ